MNRFNNDKGKKNNNRKFVNRSKNDIQYGMESVRDGPPRVAYLSNLKSSSIEDEDLIERSVVSLYFVEQNGNWFQSYILYEPYFYILCKPEVLGEMGGFLEKKFEKRISKIEIVEKVDLDMINHLSGKLAKYIKLSFRTVADLIQVRNIIKQRVDQKKKTQNEFNLNDIFQTESSYKDYMDAILDIREYDVPYHARVLIDLDLRVSYWYNVSFKDGMIDKLEKIPNKTLKPNFKILAFDIETTKLPLKFPDAKIDCIMMISYVIDGDAFLIVNREIVLQDVEDFEYTPKPEYEGRVTVMNEPNEWSVLDRFFTHIKETKPFIFVSFNGDQFDWPFIEARANFHGFNLDEAIGIEKHEEEYYGRFATHMDCLYWVVRDAFLPQGSHGLKAVTKAKLGYNPVELDPELMLPMARSDPQVLAEYSVSDAIATYYLYKKHIHDFIFALCTIIPMYPDEVLRKGSGTLCENLLMAEAVKRNIIFPNKSKEEFEKFYNGHLLDNETYIGGKVECIHAGVYRSDLPEKFRLDTKAYQELIDDLDRLLEFVCKVELGINIEDIVNKEAVKAEIAAKLQKFTTVPSVYECKPLIYHLDVLAMYPNIILTNRLQPVAIVNDKICSGCVFNTPESNCKRNMSWEWRGEYYPISRAEYEQIKLDVENEQARKMHDAPAQYEQGRQQQQGQQQQSGGGGAFGAFGKRPDGTRSQFENNLEATRDLIRKRVKLYSQKTYKKVRLTKVDLREDTVCMRENPFYVESVRAFKDRRYVFKNLVKIWKGKAEEYAKEGNLIQAQEAQDMTVFYDSQQIAHKVILNSFYGYVMRRGARWYSMEMAAMVTHIGSNVISDTKRLVDKVGKPLELDTDGIWCLLPEGFPQDFTLKTNQGKNLRFSYPCSIFNILIHEKYANTQYQDLADPKTLKYDTRTEMSIFFEIDGPYRAMIIPAAREEGKLLKKRYAVFNHNGSIQEIKGFELKRRGELKIIKIFQQDVFQHYLAGSTLEECYNQCGIIAERWLTILHRKGKGLDDDELVEYIGESKVLSKNIEEYDVKKGVAITTAKRIGEFLGNDLSSGKGLNCLFIISKKPDGAPVNERAIPTSVFAAEEPIKKKFLRKWLKEPDLQDFDMRSIIDWDYYIERLGNTIQKMLTIPAAFQKIKNPVPSVAYPEWLRKVVRDYDLKCTQQRLDAFAKPLRKVNNALMDIEDIGGGTKREITRFGNVFSKTPTKNSVAKAQAEVENSHPNQETHGEITMEKFTPEKVPSQVMSSQGVGYHKMKNEYDMLSQFPQWLKTQKQHWSEQRKMLKRDARSSRISSAKGSVSKLRNMFRTKEEEILTSVWHIIQVYETETKGLYKLWIYLENSQIVSVKVNIPRTIYINSLVSEKVDDFKLVKKKLPRDKKVHYLYERVFKEEEFIKKFNSFDMFLTNPNIEGVYEKAIPLDFKFICERGCIVKVNRNKELLQQGYANYIFSPEDLQPLFNHENSYLNSFDMNQILISHITIRNKSVWGVFNESMREFHFFLVDPNALKQNFKKFIKDILRTKQGVDLSESLKIKVEYTATTDQALKSIEKVLLGVKERTREPFLVILQSSYEIKHLIYNGMKSLVAEYPVLPLGAVDSSGIQFSSIDWQVKSLRALCENYLNFDQQVQELLDFCRYAHIPLCNLKDQKLNFITDVVYSRILKSADCLSWYSNRGKPEIGGGKEDDARELIPTDFISSDISNPGLYFDYCVEISVSLLVLNTICASDELKNIDKESSKIVDPKTLREDFDHLDESGYTKTAFKLLKVMIDGWVLDILRNNNPRADELLDNIHRWLCSGESKLFDPMMNRMLNKLMKKIYGYLLQKLKTLGAKIISANLQKITISTGKQTLHEAQNYSNFILKTVISYPLFSNLNLSPQKYWKVLFYKDNYNYSGIPDDPSITEARIFSSWNIAEYLPPKLEDLLMMSIAEYLLYVNDKVSNDSNMQSEEMQDGQQILNEKLVKYSKKFVADILAPKLYEALPGWHRLFRENQIIQAEQAERELQSKGLSQIHNTQRLDGQDQGYIGDLYQDDRSEADTFNDDISVDDDEERKERVYQTWSYPETLGRVSQKQDGVIEFINYLAHILDLDSNIKEEVITLKRNALKLLGKSDFEEVAEYVDPCRKVVLSDIYCKSCSSIMRVDLFRDDYLKHKSWRCPACASFLDEKIIQNKIINVVRQSLLFHQIQDLYCKKCKMVKTESLTKLCKCSGKYDFGHQSVVVNDLAFDDDKTLSNLREVANLFKFQLLEDLLLQLSAH